jgi:hypothetical protein
MGRRLEDERYFMNPDDYIVNRNHSDDFWTILRGELTVK